MNLVADIALIFLWLNLGECAENKFMKAVQNATHSIGGVNKTEEQNILKAEVQKFIKECTSDLSGEDFGDDFEGGGKNRGYNYSPPQYGGNTGNYHRKKNGQNKNDDDCDDDDNRDDRNGNNRNFGNDRNLESNSNMGNNRNMGNNQNMGNRNMGNNQNMGNNRNMGNNQNMGNNRNMGSNGNDFNNDNNRRHEYKKREATDLLNNSRRENSRDYNNYGYGTGNGGNNNPYGGRNRNNNHNNRGCNNDDDEEDEDNYGNRRNNNNNRYGNNRNNNQNRRYNNNRNNNRNTNGGYGGSEYGNNNNNNRNNYGSEYGQRGEDFFRTKRSNDNIQCISQCVFGYLEVLNDNRVPSESAVIKFLQDHIPNEAKRIKALREARRCFARLASSSDNQDGCEFSKQLSKCLNLDIEK